MVKIKNRLVWLSFAFAILTLLALNFWFSKQTQIRMEGFDDCLSSGKTAEVYDIMIEQEDSLGVLMVEIKELTRK